MSDAISRRDGDRLVPVDPGQVPLVGAFAGRRRQALRLDADRDAREVAVVVGVDLHRKVVPHPLPFTGGEELHVGGRRVVDAAERRRLGPATPGAERRLHHLVRILGLPIAAIAGDSHCLILEPVAVLTDVRVHDVVVVGDMLEPKQMRLFLRNDHRRVVRVGAAVERIGDAAVKVLAEERRYPGHGAVDLAPGTTARRNHLGVEAAARRPGQREDDVEVGVPAIEIGLHLLLAIEQRLAERAFELGREAAASVVVRRRERRLAVGIDEVDDLGCRRALVAGHRGRGLERHPNRGLHHRQIALQRRGGAGGLRRVRGLAATTAGRRRESQSESQPAHQLRRTYDHREHDCDSADAPPIDLPRSHHASDGGRPVAGSQLCTSAGSAGTL